MTLQKQLEILTEKLERIKAIDGFANAESVRDASPSFQSPSDYAAALDAAFARDAIVREENARNLSSIRAAIEFVNQQINLEHCLSL